MAMRAVICTMLALSLASGAAARAAHTPDLKGFELDTVYGLASNGALTKLVNGESRRRRRRLLETAGVKKGKFDGTRGDLVRLMAALHMISYAPGTGTASGAELQSGVAKAAFSFSAEQVDPIFTAGDQDTLLTLGVKYNVNITQLEAYPQFWESYRSAYNEEGQKLRFLQTPDVAAGEMFAESFGAFAMVYRDTKGSSVIAYRGTYSTGDFANIAFGEATWFSDRLRWGMQQTWDFFKDRHGAWGEEEEKRESYLKSLSRGLYVLGTQLQVGSFAATLHTRYPSVPEATFDKLGYWPLLKALTNQILDDDLGDDEVYITGHSQGGGAAALMSMYIEKSRGRVIDTITFAAVGGACFARALGWPTDSSYLPDVDPYRYYRQITDYADVYDVWGNMDVDPGKTCYYGVSTKRAAYKYCKPIQGYQGTLLMAAQDSRIRQLSGFSAVSDQFAQCRSLTHNSPMVMANLVYDDTKFLNEDGSTDGGCFVGGVYGLVPDKNDRYGICPAGGLNEELGGVVTGIVFALLAIALGICGIIGLVCWGCNKRFGCFSRCRRTPKQASGAPSVA